MPRRKVAPTPVQIGLKPTRVGVFPGSSFSAADAWIDSGVWAGCYSSDVASIMYEKEAKNLYVEFTTGAVYRYAHVPASLARWMFHAVSVGKFLAQMIKGRFSYYKIRGAMATPKRG